MGASFRANLVQTRGETAKLRACQKVPTDRQTDRQTAFRLYIVDDDDDDDDVTFTST